MSRSLEVRVHWEESQGLFRGFPDDCFQLLHAPLFWREIYSVIHVILSRTKAWSSLRFSVSFIRRFLFVARQIILVSCSAVSSSFCMTELLPLFAWSSSPKIRILGTLGIG